MELEDDSIFKFIWGCISKIIMKMRKYSLSVSYVHVYGLVEPESE